MRAKVTTILSSFYICIYQDDFKVLDVNSREAVKADPNLRHVKGAFLSLGTFRQPASLARWERTRHPAQGDKGEIRQGTKTVLQEEWEFQKEAKEEANNGNWTPSHMSLVTHPLEHCVTLSSASGLLLPVSRCGVLDHGLDKSSILGKIHFEFSTNSRGISRGTDFRNSPPKIIFSNPAPWNKGTAC